MDRKLKILILDDDDVRHRNFHKALEEHDLFHAYGFNEFVELLHQESPFDIIYLDHDLGDRRIGDSCSSMYGNHTYTGQDAAQVVVNLEESLRPGRVIVHSWNGFGAGVMHEKLYRANIKCSRELYKPLGADVLKLLSEVEAEFLCPALIDTGNNIVDMENVEARKRTYETRVKKDEIHVHSDSK